MAKAKPKKSQLPPLFTIGYEKAAQADVLATLSKAGIELLIDVRDRPQSRRAGFSKSTLAASLDDAGLRYVHLKALGTPPEGREANRTRKWDTFWRIVEARLKSPEAEIDLQRAAELARAAPACLLCYEADWHVCHRRRVAEILAERHGFRVQHLAVDRRD
jgi:uncharacterized protein (DUF488 family)